MNRKTLFLGGALFVTLAMIGGTVQAARHFGGPMETHVIGFLDTTLQKNPLTPQQKQAIESALEQAKSQAQANKDQRKQMVDQALNLFQADKLDTAALQKLQSEHMARMSGHLIPVVSEVHDILTPAQRQELVAAIRDRIQQHGGHGFGGW